MKKTTISLSALLICLSSLAQFPAGCDISEFDGVNLVPEGGYEMLPAGDVPFTDCWRSILFAPDVSLGYSNISPDIPHEGYSAFDSKYIDTRCAYLGGADDLGNSIVQIDPMGRYGPLYNPILNGVEYVASAMVQVTTPVSSDQPSVALIWQFDNENLTDLPPLNNSIGLQVNDGGVPSNNNSNLQWLPDPADRQLLPPAFVPTEQDASGTFTVSDEWNELNLEFTADDDYSNLLFLTAASPTILDIEGSTDIAYLSDDVCIVPVSENPISVTLLENLSDPSSETYKLEKNYVCGETNVFRLTYHVSTSFVGQNTDHIILQLAYDNTELAIVSSGGSLTFNGNGVLVLPALSVNENGVDVTVAFAFTGLTAGSSSQIGVSIMPTPLRTYLCHEPSAQITLVRPCPGDFDGNGLITASDLSEMLNSPWGSTAGPCGLRDFDCDGLITVGGDFSLFISAFGTLCPSGYICP